MVELLFASVRARDVDRVQDLLFLSTRTTISSSSNSLVRYADGTGSTALHLAAQKGDAAMCKLLLMRGALHCSVDYEGMSPLHIASSIGNDDVILVLIKRRDGVGEWAEVDAFSAKGLTPLMLAVIGGHSDVVDTLLWIAEADRNLCEQNGTNTALDYARLWGHNLIVEQFTVGRKREKKKKKKKTAAMMTTTMIEGTEGVEGTAPTIKKKSSLSLPALTAAPWLDADDYRSSMLVFNSVQRGWRPIYV